MTTATRHGESLATVPSGKRVVVKHVQESLTLGQRRRFAELGIRVGSSFTVTQKTSGGGVVIKCGATRYAVDKASASKIEVAVA